MKIDLLQPILDYEGKPIKNPDGTEFTLRSAMAVALNNQAEGEPPLTGEQKAKIYRLSVKIYEDKECDLTVDDRAFIKERAGKVLTSVAFGRVSDMLEEKKAE
jgi:hypothetical protein